MSELTNGFKEMGYDIETIEISDFIFEGILANIENEKTYGTIKLEIGNKKSFSETIDVFSDVKEYWAGFLRTENNLTITVEELISDITAYQDECEEVTMDDHGIKRENLVDYVE